MFPWGPLIDVNVCLIGGLRGCGGGGGWGRQKEGGEGPPQKVPLPCRPLLGPPSSPWFTPPHNGCHLQFSHITFPESRSGGGHQKKKKLHSPARSTASRGPKPTGLNRINMTKQQGTKPNTNKYSGPLEWKCSRLPAEIICYWSCFDIILTKKWYFVVTKYGNVCSKNSKRKEKKKCCVVFVSTIRGPVSKVKLQQMCLFKIACVMNNCSIKAGCFWSAVWSAHAGFVLIEEVGTEIHYKVILYKQISQWL